MTAPRAAAAPVASADRAARAAERLLRTLGDARTGVSVLLLTGLVNGLAALHPDGPRTLDGWPYAALLGILALTGVAAVAVRAPAAWREWRQPAAIHPGAGALLARIERRSEPAEIAERLRMAGYRPIRATRRGRWTVNGVRRGWARFAAQASHLAIVVIVLGVAIGAAFGSEARFSLHAGDQALLDAPRSGFSSAVRLEGFDAEFDPDGRPLRLDTTVTFLRDGVAVEERLVRVNEPASFDGYLLHPWTYGPSVRLRISTLDGSPLLDAPVPLDATRDGVPIGSVALPTAAGSLGLALTDPSANELGVTLVDQRGRVDTARLRPGEERRLGTVIVALGGFDAWVTFLSRRDPGVLVLFGGAAILCGSLAVALWMPRRRVTVRQTASGVLLILRGERFDRPADELARLRRALEAEP